MPEDFRERLKALQLAWLEKLEQDAAEGCKPGYQVNDKGVQWSDWRLKLTQCLRETSEILALTQKAEERHAADSREIPKGRVHEHQA